MPPTLTCAARAREQRVAHEGTAIAWRDGRDRGLRPAGRARRRRRAARPGRHRPRRDRPCALRARARRRGLPRRRARGRRRLPRPVRAPRTGGRGLGRVARRDAAVGRHAHGARRAERRGDHLGLGRLERRGLRGPRHRPPRAGAHARVGARVDRRGQRAQGPVDHRCLPDRALGPRDVRRARRRPAVAGGRVRDAPGTARPGRCPGPAPPPRPRAARPDELEARAAQMTERRFTTLRYRGPGTELEAGLIDGHRWIAGRNRTAAGRPHVANMPTEEVFTSPHRMRAEGTVRATMPFALRGGIVEGLELRFSGGEIVEARAARGEELVRSELATDKGAKRLGELALVADSSRIGDTGVVFKNTLFDENAASHIAWGAGLAWTLDGLPPEEHEAAGLNESQTHTDFMIGSSEVEVDGVEAGGAAVPLLRDGTWQLTG